MKPTHSEKHEVLLRTGKYSKAPKTLVSELKTYYGDKGQLIKGFPMVRIKAKTSKIKWTGLDRLEKCYDEIVQFLMMLVVNEFQGYVIQGRAPNMGGKDHPAMARGRESMESLFNSPRLKRGDRPGQWYIEVINKVWLYQEYGFDMKNMAVPGPVAERMLKWAIDKGLLEIIVGTPENLKSQKAIRLRTTSENMGDGDREYRTFTMEDYYSTPYVGNLNHLKWKIASIVVRNNSGRDNRRMFLTCAYQNIMMDGELVKSVEIKFLEKYGFRKKVTEQEAIAIEVPAD